ncbi:MAG: PHP domain-containing protein [Butyricicoccus sp.]
MAQTDLQIHSSLTAGGELSPRALAERCCEERLTLAALTDRRAVSGVPECIWRGAELGVRIVHGIELDCRWREQDFLTLGIGIDITCPALLEIERTRNDSVQSFAAEQAIHTIHEAGGLAVLVPPNEMDDTFPVAAFDGIAAYSSHARRTLRGIITGTQTRFVVTGGSGFLSEDKPPYRPGAVDFYGHEPQVAAAFLAAIHHLNEEKRSFHHDSI